MNTVAFDRLPEGTAIAGCILGSFVGKGSCAAVYKAIDSQSGIPVAIKVLNPLFSGDGIMRERLIRELRIGKSIKNSHCAASFRLQEDRNLFCLIMEWIEGTTLESELSQGKSLPLEAAKNILLQLLDGLEILHTNGILHRDIKPANIMIAPDKTIKLIDYGVARVINAATLTRTGSRLGSIEYLAPEYLLGHGYDARCDYYSLGVILYRILTGQFPHAVRDDKPLALRLTAEKIDPPSVFRPDLPKTWDKLVLWLLEPNPESRLASAELVRHVISDRNSGPGEYRLETRNKCRHCGRNLMAHLPFCAHCGATTLLNVVKGHSGVVIENCTDTNQLFSYLKRRYRPWIHPKARFLGRRSRARILLVHNISRDTAENIAKDFVYMPFGLSIESSRVHLTWFSTRQSLAILTIGIIFVWIGFIINGAALSDSTGLPAINRIFVFLTYIIGFFAPLSFFLYIQRLPLLAVHGKPWPANACLDEKTLAVVKEHIGKLQYDPVKSLFAHIVTQFALLSDRLPDMCAHNTCMTGRQKGLIRDLLIRAAALAQHLDVMQLNLSHNSLNAFSRKNALIEAEISREADMQRLDGLIKQRASINRAIEVYRENSCSAEHLRNTLVQLAGSLSYLNSVTTEPATSRTERLESMLKSICKIEVSMSTDGDRETQVKRER